MAPGVGQLPSSQGDEQGRWLKEASMSVKRNSFFMKRALDEDNLRDALRYSAAMLGELRTSLLGPQRYYELYMQAFDELRHLEVFFAEEHKKGRSFADLYELVQHAGNVLPRLYLMCTVGACFIRSKEGHARDVLRDLAEMCKGVQHPTRGLFLRSYLCQVCRTLLPDVGSPYEGPEGGTTVDALDFLLLNFTEMNKLAVVERHRNALRLPPITIHVCEGDSHVTIRVSDQGGGIPEGDLARVWRYGYSTINSSQRGADSHGAGGAEGLAQVPQGGFGAAWSEVAKYSAGAARYSMGGLGFGLPLSRLYARYFGGNLKLMSMPGYGVDAFLNLRRLEEYDWEEAHAEQHHSEDEEDDSERRPLGSVAAAVAAGGRGGGRSGRA